MTYANGGEFCEDVYVNGCFAYIKSVTTTLHIAFIAHNTACISIARKASGAGRIMVYDY